MADVRDFLDALIRVADGCTALLARARRHPHHRLTPREEEVLALMAEGLSTRASPAGW